MARVAATLEAEGWVDIIPNAGAVVTSVDVHSWHRTMNLLARLEGYATALSAPRLTPEQLAEARLLNRRMGEALANFDPQSFGDLNRTFHELLCSQSDDPRLNDLVHAEWARLDLIRRTAFWYAPGRALASLSEHDQILDLIEGGAEPDLIETSVRRHEINTLERWPSTRPSAKPRHPLGADARGMAPGSHRIAETEYFAATPLRPLARGLRWNRRCDEPQGKGCT